VANNPLNPLAGFASSLLVGTSAMDSWNNVLNYVTENCLTEEERQRLSGTQPPPTPLPAAPPHGLQTGPPTSGDPTIDTGNGDFDAAAKELVAETEELNEIVEEGYASMPDYSNGFDELNYWVAEAKEHWAEYSSDPELACNAPARFEEDYGAAEIEVDRVREEDMPVDNIYADGIQQLQAAVAAVQAINPATFANEIDEASRAAEKANVFIAQFNDDHQSAVSKLEKKLAKIEVFVGKADDLASAANC
jgi:hypothetical protein